MTTVTSQSDKRFTLGRELGRGSFGVVYLASGEGEEAFALKMIGPVTDKADIETFEREIRSAQSVHNDHVLQVHDFGSYDDPSGQTYLFAVMDLCRDGSFRAKLEAYRLDPFDVTAIVTDFQQILAGLGALHTKIIHRDVKPENIFIDQSVIKVGDFGLSRFIDNATRTLTFKGLGSPRYMAPEVWDMQRATPATDLYAIGVMLFEAATHQTPFPEGANVNALRQMDMFTPAARVKSINPQVPTRLDDIIKRLLEKEPAHRYQSAEEVIDALGRVHANPTTGGIAEIAARLRQHHDAAEQKHLERERQQEAALSERERDRYMEQQLRNQIEEIVSEINAQLEGPTILTTKHQDDIVWRFGKRALRLRFFRPGEIFLNPEVPGRMPVLRQRHVMHGGYLEISEDGNDREGWNVVLVRPPESMYGQWILVETDLSALTGRSARYKPFATEAKLFADNLACHWQRAMHVYILTDKPLEREDLIKILGAFVR